MHDYTLHNYSRARRSVRSTLNPPAHRHPGERRRAEPWLRNPAGGSCPGSASPAEASAFQTFFSSIFSPRNLLPKILPRASPGDAPGTPKTSKVRHFAKKSRPQDPTFLVFSVDPCFSHFLLWFLVTFSWKTSGKKRIRERPCTFFLDLATLTIVCILQYESHLSCFCFHQVFH